MKKIIAILAIFISNINHAEVVQRVWQKGPFVLILEKFLVSLEKDNRDITQWSFFKF